MVAAASGDGSGTGCADCGDEPYCRGRCRRCYEASRVAGDVESEGATPERMAELHRMAEEGTLAGHCRRLLLRTVDDL